MARPKNQKQSDKLFNLPTMKGSGKKAKNQNVSAKSANSKKSTKSSGSTHSRKSKNTTGKTKEQRSLNPLREQLQVLVETANARAAEIIGLGLPSRALMEAQRTLKKQSSRVDDTELFKSNLRTRQQINREFARVQSFLSDYTSTAQGAYDFTTDLSSLKGAWGKQWMAKAGGLTYDPSKISKEQVGEVFRIYRKLTELAGGWERAVGAFKGKESLIGYGSEVLISNVYDMYINNLYEGDILEIGYRMVTEAINDYDEMSEKARSDYDYGIVFDDETTRARRKYYERRYQWAKERGLYD